MLKRWSFLLAALVGSVGLVAGNYAPIGIGAFPPAQYPGEKTPVYGFRLNLAYAYNPKLYGFEVGIINNAEVMAGWSIGAGNFVKSFDGVQMGLFNRTGWYEADEATCSNGWQAGWLNDAQYPLTGVQTGMANLADTVAGLQIGFSNTVVAASPTGWTLQIGFLNFNDDGYWPIMPLVGWSAAKPPVVPELVIEAETIAVEVEVEQETAPASTGVAVQ